MHFPEERFREEEVAQDKAEGITGIFGGDGKDSEAHETCRVVPDHLSGDQAAGENAIDDQKRIELYQQAAKRLTETAANVYIQDLADFVVMKKNLDGYVFYPLYVMDMANVHYVK